ncbi:hypothetical protein I4F81_005983 [Pyropia yezoensis]|uniref:Uncharacterized protein n=1 Tax=Pyropia yezoensis TaxID=2788 RepID=A0ACC3C0V8_PYRYE|nr:hypothetical protein I4F81_005983 [Neopyropia yezoensis]
MFRRRLGGGGGGGGGDDGRASFAAAVRAGDVAAVRVALAANTTLGRVPLDGTTPPLHEASKLGHHVVVEELLRAGAAVDVADKYGMTPLRVAAAEGHEDVVEQLLRAGAAVDAADKDGMTPLQMAAGGGDTDVADQLLRAGATVDAADKEGITPLHMAAGGGDTDVADQLLRAGAIVDAADKNGMTPLYVAAGGGHADVAEQLLRAGAAVDAADKDGITPLHMAANVGHTADSETPLHMAANGGHTDVAEQLLRAGAAVDAADNNGMTPLYVASGLGHKDVAEQLLRAGAAVDAADKDGRTPLHMVAYGGHADVAEQLLRAGAAVNAADKDGRTPLHVAGGGGHADVAEQLLRAGAAVDVADKDGLTPLHAAAEMALIRADDDVPSRALEAVRVLVAWGAVVSDDVRPSAVSASRTRGKRLRTVLSTTRVLSPEEVRDAKAEWSAAAATAKDEVTAVSAAATALAELRKVHDGFLAAPETLTLADIKEELLRGRIRDVRCLRLAHRMLLFADRVGVFVCEDRAVTTQRRHDLFEQVYQPAVGWLDTGDRGLVAAIVRHAADQGLVERVHLSIMGVALELDHKFSTQLKAVVERLNRLESAMTTAGQLLCDTMQELRDLKEHLIEKEELDRRVALAKSAVKIGVSLAPIVGAALNAGVDVAAVFADGTTELAVVCRHLVDPADIGAARQILQRVSDASSTLPAAKLEQLQAAVRPYASLEDVNVDLEFAEQALVDAGVEDEGVLADMPQAEDGSVLKDPPSDQAEDRCVKFKDVVTDVAIDHCVEEAAAQKRGRAQPGSIRDAKRYDALS